jgi:hypothetical protein
MFFHLIRLICLMFPKCHKRGSRYVEVDNVIFYFIYLCNLFFSLIRLCYLGSVIAVHLIVNLISSRNVVHMPWYFRSDPIPWSLISRLLDLVHFAHNCGNCNLWLFSFPRWPTCRERPIIHGDTRSLRALPTKWLAPLGHTKCGRMMFRASIT